MRLAHRRFQYAEQHCAERPDWKFVNRFAINDNQLALACLLLDHAQRSKTQSSSPLLSNFRVGACLFFEPQCVGSGANYEFGAGLHQAYDEGVHAEEAALANAFNTFGTHVRVAICAIVSDAPQASTPCGKCRSVLQTYASGDVLVVSAGKDLVCQMWKLSELLPVNFPQVEAARLSDYDKETLGSLLGKLASSRDESRSGFASRVLGISSCVISADGRLYSIPRVDSLAFYSTSSLRATIASVLKDRPSRIDGVLVRSLLPALTGEDRQLLFEFAALFNQTTTLPVYWQRDGVSTLWTATPATLLPNAFGPADLHT